MRRGGGGGGVGNGEGQGPAICALARGGQFEEFVSGYRGLIKGLKGQLYPRPPSQNPVFLNSYTFSVFFHSRKRPAPGMNAFFSSRGFPRTRPSTVVK